MAIFTNEPNISLKEKVLPFLESPETQHIIENRDVTVITQYVADFKPPMLRHRSSSRMLRAAGGPMEAGISDHVWTPEEVGGPAK